MDLLSLVCLIDLLCLADQGPQHLKEADEGPRPKAPLQDNWQGRGLSCGLKMNLNTVNV